VKVELAPKIKAILGLYIGPLISWSPGHITVIRMWVVKVELTPKIEAILGLNVAQNE
jgi:hypothetical protein